MGFQIEYVWNARIVAMIASWGTKEEVASLAKSGIDHHGATSARILDMENGELVEIVERQTGDYVMLSVCY